MTNIRIYQGLKNYFLYYLNSLLANKVIFLCLFFSFPIVFKITSTIPLLIRNTSLIVALVIPTSVPMVLKSKEKETPLLALDKISKVVSA